MATKIIVFGDVSGQFPLLVKKLTAGQTKNNFSFAIIVGDLFAEDDDTLTELLAGNIHIPLPTYFTVGVRAFPQRVKDRLSKDEELCANLHYLGKRGTNKTSEGVRIVALGGRVDDTIVAGLSKEQVLPFHTIDDAKSLKGANSADILLTGSWPTSIQVGSKVPLPTDAVEPPSYPHISDLLVALKPRYHFSTSLDFFWEREPFLHPPAADTPESKQVTRFISLAALGNPLKQKYWYAFTLQSSADATASLPDGTTASPFALRVSPNGKKRPALEPDPYSRFSIHESRPYHRHKRSKRGKQPPLGQDECYFCLSNSAVKTHLVSSIGDEAYLTTAPGPLTTSTTYSALGLDFPGHILIIPLTHSPTIALIPEQDSRAKTFSEMTHYRKSLQSMVADRSSERLGSVTYEISRGNGVHDHWQFLPIPKEVGRLKIEAAVEAAFTLEAKDLNYPDFEIRDPGLGEKDGDFFRIWIWTPPSEEFPEGSTRCLTMPLNEGFRFDLQFARRVLAKLLGLQERVQWKDCSQTEDEEKQDVEAFKAAFKDFDFSL